jgi:GNAT superfamily N-acetyltransferase
MCSPVPEADVPRLATPDDAPALARLINDAFIVEAFFKIGDRTSAEDITELMRAGGEFLVLESQPRRGGETAKAETGTPLACVYLKVSGDRAYFGMLSIDPARQRQGLGRQMIQAVEARARQRGCRFMDIHIVNLREELPPYYRALGYIESGTLPFSEPERASRPCSFVVMSKAL